MGRERLGSVSETVMIDRDDEEEEVGRICGLTKKSFLENDDFNSIRTCFLAQVRVP